MNQRPVALTLIAFAALALPLSLGACASEEIERSETDRSPILAGGMDPVELFQRGFSLTSDTGCRPGEHCDLAVVDRAGSIYGAGDVQWASVDLSFGLAPLDRDTIGRYTIYVWPSSIPHRNYNAIADQMREYSTLVGTLLNRAAEGPGEETWADYHRSAAFHAVWGASRRGTTEFCGAVIKSMVDSLVPEGSDFRQYGNCGEGGHIGACLAHKAGFGDEEIRVCASDNDHFFAMVKAEEASKAWCILDRWPLINRDNYACEVDWDEPSRGITFKGNRVAMEWFEDVTCVTLGTYLANGARVTSMTSQ